MTIKLLLSPYDFTKCTQLPSEERIKRCVEEIYQSEKKMECQIFKDIPAVPQFGATEEEIQDLEKTRGIRLPEDYRSLLRQHRYIVCGEGITIYGFDYQGVGICSSPFVINNFFTPGRFVAIGDYWRFADGDQLLIALHEANQPVYAYFHEHGPHIEYFAPNVTSTLWRIVFEKR